MIFVNFFSKSTCQNMDASGSWDDSSSDGYSDEEFDLDESMAETPAHSPDKAPAAGAAAPAAAPGAPDAADLAADAADPASLPALATTESPEQRQPLTARGRGRMGSLLVTGSTTSLQSSSSSLSSPNAPSRSESPIKRPVTEYGRGRTASLLVSGSASLNIPVWGEAATAATAAAAVARGDGAGEGNGPDDNSFGGMRAKGLLRGISVHAGGGSTSSGSLNIPTWGSGGTLADVAEEDEEDESDVSGDGPAGTAAAAAGGAAATDRELRSLNLPTWGGDDGRPPVRYNRNLANPSAEADADEYLSPSTSLQVAAMMKQAWQRPPQPVSERETDRVLAWLAKVAAPGPLRYADRETMLDGGSRWHVNPSLVDSAVAARRKATGTAGEGTAAAPPPLSALADPAATPGSVEEGVLELICESLLDELRYPRQSNDEDEEFARAWAMASEEDRPALAALRRRTQPSATDPQPTRRPAVTASSSSSPQPYSIPDVSLRPAAEHACEQAYLQVVRRACLDEPEQARQLAKASGLPEELARKVQKELAGAVCDMFTDPAIVTTLKTAVLSRVFAGTRLPAAAPSRGRFQSP